MPAGPRRAVELLGVRRLLAAPFAAVLAVLLGGTGQPAPAPSADRTPGVTT